MTTSYNHYLWVSYNSKSGVKCSLLLSWPTQEAHEHGFRYIFLMYYIAKSFSFYKLPASNKLENIVLQNVLALLNEW